MIRCTSFRNKTVAVFGLGGSGLAAAKALAAGGADVVCWDDGEAGREAALKAGLFVKDLEQHNWREFAALVLSPGVPLTHPKPHWTVEKAKAASVEIIGDVELFARERDLVAPGSPWIAITGTNGKSTTTALTAHLLDSLGCDVAMGGNIGKAILALATPAMDRVHVVEMSSYQIDLSPTARATVGVLLNITPDHLDRHGTIDNYAAVKARLVERADAACICVDDAWTREIAAQITPVSKLYAFTSGKGAAIVPKFYAIGASLFVHDKQDGFAESRMIADLTQSMALRGAHNAQNALAALAAIRALADQLQDSNPALAEKVWNVDALCRGLMSFPGLAHRLQPVASLDGVTFVNDSKATNAESTEKALLSFDGNIYWIAGGRAKDGGIEALRPLFGRVARAYLIGEAAEDFAVTLEGQCAHRICGTLEQAVTEAARDAKTEGRKGAVVLLSPACASFDQYANFERRGEHFCQVVSALQGVSMHEGVA